MQKLDGTLVLSASDLTNHLACEHLVQLERLVAEEGLQRPPPPAAGLDEILRRRGLAHEQGELERLRASGLRIAVIDHDSSGTAGLRAAQERTLEAMRDGVDVVYQATFFDGRWRGHADFLHRVDGVDTAFGGWGYEAHDTKLALRTKATTLVQLAEYSAHITRLQGRAPEHIHALLGDGRLETYALRDVEAFHRAARERLERALRDRPPTYPERVSHCGICDWREVCDARRRADDDLSLVAGIRRDQVRALRTAGIGTRAALGAADPPELDAISAPVLQRLHQQARLQVRASRDGGLPWELLPCDQPGTGLGALPEPDPGDVFFDMEGDPHYETGVGLEYLFGVVTVDGGAPRFTAEWAHSRDEERVAFERTVDRLVARLEAHPGMHVYHYAEYEVAALKKLMGRHATREAEVDRLLRAQVFVDLYAVVRQGVRIGTESYSLKKLEPLYMGARRESVTSADDSIVAYERFLASGDRGALEDIERYNEVDCRSTLLLRDWLEARRADYAARFAVEPPRRPLADGLPTDEQAQRAADVAALAARLEGVEAGAAGEARSLLASLLDWHQREARPQWWSYFARLVMTPDELYEDTEALSGLVHQGPVGIHRRSQLHRYTFDPEQEHKIGPSSQLVDPQTGRDVALHRIDARAGVLVLRRSPESDQPHPTALVGGRPFDTRTHRAALMALGAWVAEHGVDAPGEHRAARDLLLARPPRRAVEGPLRVAGEEASAAARRVSLELDGGVLAVQGPPGSGKTHTGAQMIVDLVERGRTAGITANSHKAIGNLLAEVCRVARERGVALRAVQRADGADGCDDAAVTCTDNPGVAAALDSGEAQVVAGTAWLLARPEMRNRLSHLFVDEAGQLSLANALAVAGAARNLVLLGDPRQLASPVLGTHPPGSDRSALEHLLQGAATIPDDRGVFLDRSWRMHPGVCRFVSETFYDARLGSDPSTATLCVDGVGAGMRRVEVTHSGRRVQAPEEVTAVDGIVRSLIGRTWRDRGGSIRPLTLTDILVVAPYNAHVNRLLERLPEGARAGTVDRFQGQEAAVVVYTMATSSADDLPRAFEFLYSLNRFNVAVSRAKALSIVVFSPRLLTVAVRRPEHVILANALCRLVELAPELEIGAPR